jgi:type VI secretion system protein ImpH
VAGTAWTYLGHLSDYVIYDEDEIEVEDELQRLVHQGHRYNFFQAVRIIEQSFTDAAPVGGQGPVSREVVRFRPHLSYSYAASDLKDIRVEGESEGEIGDGEMPRLVVSCQFLGIYGASSPLPSYFTEQLLDLDDDQPLPRQVLDLFGHRIYSLLYRIFKKYRPAAEPQARPESYFSARLATFLGLESYGGMPAWLLGYADILAMRPVSAGAMEAAICRLLPGVTATVEPCVKTWTAIPHDQLPRLGVSGSSLGRDCWLGRLVPNRSTSFRIAIGPVHYDRFLALLPGGGLHRRLATLIDVLNQNALDCEVRLSTRAATVPPVRLGANHYNLGWNARLFRRNADQRAVHHVTFPLHG